MVFFRWAVSAALTGIGWLLPYVLSGDIVDEYQIWLNTSDEHDLACLHRISACDARITLLKAPEFPPEGTNSIGQFFRFCTAQKTVYIRLDDDLMQSSHPNETRWELRGGALFFRNPSGRVTTIFDRIGCDKQNRLALDGLYQLNAIDFRHVLRMKASAPSD
jgi:hypothetical protein